MAILWGRERVIMEKGSQLLDTMDSDLNKRYASPITRENSR